MYDEELLQQEHSKERHESAECPVCKSDTFLQPDLKLLVSPCYHKMCSSCVERIYGHGARPCPTCRKSLRRYDFKEQTFENLDVEKEVDIRKRVLKQLYRDQATFCRGAEDTEELVLRRYNDYLEELEDIIFNLANGIDVAAMNDKIEQYRREVDPQYRPLPPPKAVAVPVPATVLSFVDPVLDALFVAYRRDQIEAHRRVARQKDAYAVDDDVYRFSQDPRVRAGGYRADWYWQRAVEGAGPIGGLFQVVAPL